ncbi:MAG: hypothetical protein ACHQIL_08175 [Steroidobacterales bacterium]
MRESSKPAGAPGHFGLRPSCLSFPAPSPPADRFPLYFIAYLGAGAIWYLSVRPGSRAV